MSVAAAHPAGVHLGGPEAATVPSAQLRTAAHQFEASLLQEMTKPLQHAAAPFAEDENASEGSGDALSGFASEAFAKALSDHGGFGIAAQVLRSIGDGKEAVQHATPGKESGYSLDNR